MLSEDYIVVQVNHIHYVFRVVFFQELEDFELNASLVVVLLLILDDLNGHISADFVIEAFYRSAERALTKEALDLIAEADMVIYDDLVVALIVIVAEVVRLLRATLGLLSGRRTYEVDLRVVQNLLLLILCQLVREVDESLLRRHWELRDLSLAVRRCLRFERESGADDIDS